MARIAVLRSSPISYNSIIVIYDSKLFVAADNGVTSSELLDFPIGNNLFVDLFVDGDKLFISGQDGLYIYQLF